MPVHKHYWKRDTVRSKTYLKSATMLFIEQTTVGPQMGNFKRDTYYASFQLKGLQNCGRSKLKVKENAFSIQSHICLLKKVNIVVMGSSNIFLDLQTWTLGVLQPHEMQGCMIFHLKIPIRDQLKSGSKKIRLIQKLTICKKSTFLSNPHESL